MTMTATNPTFQPPTDLNDSDNELWLVRAPANMDVSAILNNIQLDLIDPSLSNSSNNNSTTVLSKFKSSGGAAGDEGEGGSPEEEGEEYTLSLGDVNEIQNMRLLVPDEEEAKEANSDSDSDSSSDDDDDDKKKKKKETSKLLTPYTHPFQHHIHITSSYADQSELTIAPSQNSAPNPATGDDYRGSKNGRVENIRLAYVPVPQKRGLKRRWNMPGGGKIDAATVKADDASYAVKKEEEDVTDDEHVATKSTEMMSSTSSKKRVKKEEDDVVTDEDGAAKSTEKSSSKKQKSSSKHSSSKKKKRKEKKKKV